MAYSKGHGKDWMLPREMGVQHLEQLGYVDITGGESLGHYSMCSDDAVARRYYVVQDGEPVRRFVCARQRLSGPPRLYVPGSGCR